MKKSLLLAASVFALIAGNAAHAQTAPASPYYVGVQGGVAWAKLQTSPGDRIRSENTTPLLGRLSAGYQATPNSALELGYFFSGDFKQQGTNGVSTYDRKASFSGGDLSYVYKFTDVVPGLFLKAGGTYSKTTAKGTNRTLGVVTATGSGSATGFGYLFGVGYETNLSGKLDGNVSYTRYQHLAGVSGSGVNSFTVGLKYHF